MNNWRGTVSDHNQGVIMEKSGHIDPFAELIRANGASTVRCSTTQWVNTETGGFTVKFEVGLTCDQDADTLQKAGEMAFSKSLEFTSEALQLLGKK